MSWAIISRVTAAVDSRSSQKAIGRSRKRQQVARELADRLSARPVGPGEGQRQADHQPADAVGVDQGEEAAPCRRENGGGGWFRAGWR